MARKYSKRSPALDTKSPWVPWNYTKCMNARDLSRDDDYLSHLFIEKVSAISGAPLIVHRMDPRRRLPKTDMQAIFSIVQRITRTRQNENVQQAIKMGVNSLFDIHSVLYWIRDYDQRQINAFATHASRYLELYLPNGSIEIAQTSRYSRITGKNELCILATRSMPAGFLITELKGSLAELTEEEDKELRNPRCDADGGRRDFSVIHSKQLKKNHLFLGPARFVNHDCDNNCELFRDGRYITFRTIKPIAVGQELTAHYGEGYFGKNNRHCLCETCERRGKGGFAPQIEENGRSSPIDSSDTDSDSDSDTSSVMSAVPTEKEEVNVNERRTRRGVYRIVQDEHNECEDEGEEESVIGILYPGQQQAPESSQAGQVSSPEPLSTRQSSPSSVTSLPLKKRGRPLKGQSAPASAPPAVEKVVFKSVITTRGQKAREASHSSDILNFRSGSAVSDASSTPVTSQHVLRPRRLETAETPLSSVPSPKPRGRPRKYPLLEGSTPSKKEDASVERTASVRARSSVPLKTISTSGVAPEKNALRQKRVPSIPSCMTCLNPLSSEEMDEAVSGRDKGRAKGKGKGKAVHIEKECHRCLRHSAIWGASWPQRIPTPGSRCSMTRESTPSDLTDGAGRASLSAVDLRLTAARFAQLKRVKEMEHEAELVAESAVATSSLASLKRKRSDHESENGKSGGSVRTLKRRGAIQTINVRDTKIKVENADEVSLHELGKKGGSDSTVHKRSAGNVLTACAANTRKRGRSSVTDEVDAPARNPPVDEDGDDRRDKTFWPALPLLPPAGDGIKRTGLLNYRPNPALVSRWRSSPLRSAYSTDSTPTLVEDDSDGTASDDHPTTPENHGVGTPEAVDVVERGSELPDLPPTSDEEEDGDGVCEKKGTISTLRGLGLIAKPNPLVLSKRIWAPPARIVESDSEDAQSSSSEQTSVKKRRKEHVAPEQGMANASQPSSPVCHTSLSNLSIHAFRSKVKKGRFDDFDASSGEEDVILPGPPNSKLYLLQRKAFTTIDSVQTPSQAPSLPDAERTTTPKPSPPSLTLTSSPSLAKILNSPVLTLGPLHSEFLPPSPVPVPSPSFVDAGWDAEEDSDASIGPAFND